MLTKLAAFLKLIHNYSIPNLPSLSQGWLPWTHISYRQYLFSELGVETLPLPRRHSKLVKGAYHEGTQPYHQEEEHLGMNRSEGRGLVQVSKGYLMAMRNRTCWSTRGETTLGRKFDRFCAKLRHRVFEPNVCLLLTMHFYPLLCPYILTTYWRFANYSMIYVPAQYGVLHLFFVSLCPTFFFFVLHLLSISPFNIFAYTPSLQRGVGGKGRIIRIGRLFSFYIMWSCIWRLEAFKCLLSYPFLFFSFVFCFFVCFFPRFMITYKLFYYFSFNYFRISSQIGLARYINGQPTAYYLLA